MLDANQRAVAERDLVLSNLDTQKQRMIQRAEFLRGRLAEIAELVT